MKSRGRSGRALARMVKGVAPVSGDPVGELVREIVEGRGPALDVYSAAGKMTYRDDGGLSDRDPSLAVDDFSPHAMLEELRGDVPVFHYSGWFDGAYQRAAVKRFWAHDQDNHRLMIGPWEHGGRQNISPHEPSRAPLFDHEAELMRFFDAYLLRDPAATAAWEASPRVRYFTLGAERWGTAEQWPPPGSRPRRFHLHSEGGLRRERAGTEETSVVPVTGRHGTGEASRWRCLLPLLAHTHYGARSGSEVLVFDSPPLSEVTEVTGHPILHVEMESTTSDPRLFAYLEEVSRNGVVHYVTEGQLRAVHRKQKRARPASHRAIPYRTFLRKDRRSAEPGERLRLEFDLLPTSYRFDVGSRVRLVLAGADSDHFEVGPHGMHTVFVRDSWLDLPVCT